MKNKLNKNFWNKHGHVVIIYVFLGEYPKVCVNLQTDVR